MIKIFFLIVLFSCKAYYLSSNDSIDLIIPTFLGNEKRNYYGSEAPNKLNIIWKTQLGCGKTVYPNKNRDTVLMCGAGWTGQPLLIKENDELYLIQGAYDYNLRKINANNGKIVWEYSYDDVIKSTGSIWKDVTKLSSDPNKYVIIQGSRLGFFNNTLNSQIHSYRAVSYKTGKELWRYNVRKGPSYSRDVDGTALIVDDTLFIGLENGYFVKINPNPDLATKSGDYKNPIQYLELPLYEQNDIIRHRRNVITESSPALLGNHIYITSGSGHVYGYNRTTGTIDFDFFTGSDIDGSPVVTRDSCLLITIEKQYIQGKGGVFKINPRLNPDSCVIWYFPVGDTLFASWEGGIIGTCATNDYYIYPNEFPPNSIFKSYIGRIITNYLSKSVKNRKTKNSLAAFNALDAYTYVVDQEFVDPDKLVLGPCNKNKYPTPQLVFKYKTGPSISTPIFTENKLIAVTYTGTYLFEYDYNCNFRLIDKSFVSGEATPIVYDKRMFIASRDGYLYCLGNK